MLHFPSTSQIKWNLLPKSNFRFLFLFSVHWSQIVQFFIAYCWRFWKKIFKIEDSHWKSNHCSQLLLLISLSGLSSRIPVEEKKIVLVIIGSELIHIWSIRNCYNHSTNMEITWTSNRSTTNRWKTSLKTGGWRKTLSCWLKIKHWISILQLVSLNEL